MRWNNEKGEEFQNIYETGVKKITSYAWAYFKIEFDDLSEMETSNTMFYMEQESPLDIIDFIQWLHRRNIKFKLKFRYWDKADLFDNLKAFIYICKLNFEIIKTKWR